MSDLQKAISEDVSCALRGDAIAEATKNERLDIAGWLESRATGFQDSARNEAVKSFARRVAAELRNW